MNKYLNTGIKEADNIAYWLMLLIMALLPLYYWYLPPLFTLLFLTWIWKCYSAKREVFKARMDIFVLMLLFVILFSLQVISLLYSSDKEMGLSNIFGRLAMLIFPLTLFNPGAKIKTNIGLLLKIFSLSTVAYVLSCFGYALARSLSMTDGKLIFDPHLPEYEWQSYFFGPDFTYSIHPSYLAMFVVLSAFIAINLGFEKSKVLKIRIFWFLGGIFLLFSLYFISSRAGIISAFLLSITYSIFWLRRSNGRKILWIGILSAVVLLLPVVARNERVKLVLSDFGRVISKKQTEISDDRIITWKASIKIISRNLMFGVGVGDVRNDLVREYELMRAEKHVQERLNAHNQFIEVFLETGIPGFLVFLLIFYYMIRIVILRKNILYLMFIMMMLVFFTFETVLYRLAGVVFFSLFSFLLIHHSDNQLQSKTY